MSTTTSIEAVWTDFGDTLKRFILARVGDEQAAEDMLPSNPPPELDYDTWIGPSKMMPYIKGRVHREWRWNYNMGGGPFITSFRSPRPHRVRSAGGSLHRSVGAHCSRP